MPRLKLTSAAIEKLKTSNERRQEFFDTLLPGLALRVTQRGCKSWVLFYRPNGKLVRLTLGRYPVLTLAEARDKARLTLQGRHAGGILQPQPPTPPSPDPATPERLFKNAFAEFIERYAKPNNRSWQDTERLAKYRVFPHWAEMDITQIRKSNVVTLLDHIIDDGAPVQANLTFAHIRRFFNWCVERSYLDRSPCDGLKPPTKVTSRDRVLTDDEVKSIWKACDELSTPFGDLIKVLLLTGQRRGEVSGMRWNEIHDDIWTIPAVRTKNASIHNVPLHASVKERIEKNENAFEFVFTTTGETAISGFSKMKQQLDEVSGITGWRIHDLRRTAATGMARLGIQPHVVEKVLNHKSGEIRGVAAVYNRHAYISECREALDKWAIWLQDLTKAQQSP